MAGYFTPSPYTCNIREFIIDEIALDGLEGISLNMLWKRLEARISSPITVKMKSCYWNFIVNCKSISIYEVSDPLPEIDIIDRLAIVDEETGYLKDPDDFLDGPYEFTVAEDDYGTRAPNKTRSLVSEDIASMPLDNVLAEYGDRLALVASIEERWKTLAPNLPFSYLATIAPINYCMLELIGRARENGQMTTGKTNLTKIVKDPKLLFYHRKALKRLDLIRVTPVTQVTSGRAVKSLLIRLKRFHKSDILSVPKYGILHDLVAYLKSQPNFCEKTEQVLKKGLMTAAQNKKFQKKVSIFHFEEKPVTISQGNNTKVSSPSSSKRLTDSEGPKKPVRKRYISLVSKSDESSQSEDEEDADQPGKCQYKIGVHILRQAYERFLAAGRNGLTQYELAQQVGLEFYVGRTICRIFKTKNIIREFIECKGRQRLGRYIAIAATSKMDSKMKEEKEKFQKLLDEGNKLCNIKRRLSETSSDSENLIVKKKRKMENSNKNKDNLEITEVKHIDGVKNPLDKKLNLKSKVSLRQLKFANGILKVVHEKSFVLGYQTLSNQVAIETNEPPMDTKALKLLLQGMVTSGNLKIYRMKLPRSRFQYSVTICAPHVKPNDPALRAKYREMLQKVQITQKIAQKKMFKERPLTEYAYPRYVKVQKLHEALVKIMYFNDIKSEPTDLPPGFFSLKEVMSELTVGLALGHISSEGVIDISTLTIDDSVLDVKIRDAPSELYRALIKSKHLQFSLRTSLKILAQFGLIQFVVQSNSVDAEIPDNSMFIHIFYVNKNAKIIDTTGVWPRQNADKEELEISFHFDSMNVVTDYWQSVYHISTNTTVEVPNRRQKNIQIKPPIRTIAQALELDNGQIFGNGMGPCGFDSLYYIDIPRLWKAYCIRSSSLKSKLKKLPLKIPKIEIPKRAKRAPKKKIVKKPIVKKPESEVSKLPVKMGEKNKKRMRDSKTWSQTDDRLLMLCKIAITIMSPISQPGCLRVRNLVAKDILSPNDPKKTQTLIHKRAVFLETVPSLMHERNCILNVVRRQNLLSKYEGLLKKLRILHSTNINKYINEARKPMMELIWILYQISKSLPLLHSIPQIAMTYKEFHRNFTITPSGNKSCNLYKTPHDGDILHATLKEAILLTVMLSFSNPNVNKKTAEIVYSYFSKYPETELRTAIEPLRKCGAITAKDKLIRTQLQIVDLDDIVQCSYRISASYQRRWISRLNTDFPENFQEYFQMDLDEIHQNPIKASPEANCFTFEQLGNGTLELELLTVPVITGPSGSIIQEEQFNVIDIATNFKLKSGSIGWKNKKNLKSYADLYKHIRVKDAFECLSRQCFVSNKSVKEAKYDTNESIVSYLMVKKERGATFNEFLTALDYDYDKNTLTKRLTELQSNNVIKRVGFYENIVVLLKYVQYWCMAIPHGFLSPLPWLTLNCKIRPHIFYQWAGVVMNRIFENPGCSLHYLSEASEFLTVKATQDICEILMKCECVTLHTLYSKSRDLFSDDDDESPELCDYNVFESPKNIIALPTKDCLSKYSYLKIVVMAEESTK